MLLITTAAKAQKRDVDSLLQSSLKQLQLKKYEQAKAEAKLGLELSPNYVDFHLVLGQYYRFTQKADSAVYHFEKVLERSPGYHEARVALIRTELSRKNATKADALIRDGLNQKGNLKELHQLALQRMDTVGNEEATQQKLQQLIGLYPEEKKYPQRLKELKKGGRFDKVGLYHNYTTFSRSGIGPWHLSSLFYSHATKYGGIIGRYSYTQRTYSNSKIDDALYEIEAYPRLGKKNYLYLLAGAGSKNLFPKFTSAMSLYHNWGKGWNTETGFRYLRSSDRARITPVLGVEYYLGSHWFNYKIQTNLEHATVYTSHVFNYRYYTKSNNDYWNLSFGYGNSPDARDIYSLVLNAPNLESYRLSSGYHMSIQKSLLVNFSAMIKREEYISQAYQTEINLTTGLQWVFN